MEEIAADFKARSPLLGGAVPQERAAPLPGTWLAHPATGAGP